MASKRRLRRTSCNGKQRHAGEAAARAHAERLSFNGDRELHAYQCDFCRHWHVGHVRGRDLARA